MPPPIPGRLSQLDETTIGQHFSLARGDICFYVWEYTRRGGFSASPTNQLISNLKKKPSKCAANPREAPWKARAIAHSADALRALIKPEWIRTSGTIIPVPPSKIPGHPDHDDRLNLVLQQAFQGLNADIRPLLYQTQDTPADHESDDRQRFEELLEITRIDEAQVQNGPRSHIMIFDDVLNSGKHFKVARHLLGARLPGVPIIGVFLARCLPEFPVDMDFDLTDLDLEW